MWSLKNGNLNIGKAIEGKENGKVLQLQCISRGGSDDIFEEGGDKAGGRRQLRQAAS